MIRPPRAPRAPRAAAGGPAVAYLASHYPALSHTFIEREVLALRERGVRVETFTVHAAPADAPFPAVTRAEAQRTTALLGRRPAAYLRAFAHLLRTAPLAYVAGIRAALASGPWRPRAKVWQLFYLAEAVVLVTELERRGIHHIHVHHANNAADVARLAVVVGRAAHGPAAGWRWTLSMHGPTEFADVVGHDLAAKVRSADAVACISDFCRAELTRLVEPAHVAKMQIVRMSVSTDAYPAMGQERAARDAGPVRVLFVGRLVPEKGPDLLVEAVHRLRQEGTGVEAAIIGQGPLADALRAQVERLDVAGQVRLVGPVGQAELPDWYRWADVFCLPSYAEGVPVVLMEAMATELPVVTTRITGIPELVEDGLSGVLVTPGRVEELASAIARLAQSPTVRHEMGVRGRERVTRAFSPGVNAELLVDAIGLHAGDGVPA